MGVARGLLLGGRLLFSWAGLTLSWPPVLGAGSLSPFPICCGYGCACLGTPWLAHPAGRSAPWEWREGAGSPLAIVREVCSEALPKLPVLRHAVVGISCPLAAGAGAQAWESGTGPVPGTSRWAARAAGGRREGA